MLLSTKAYKTPNTSNYGIYTNNSAATLIKTGLNSINFHLFSIWTMSSKFSNPLSVKIWFLRKVHAGEISFSKSCSNYESLACANAILKSSSNEAEFSFSKFSMNSHQCMSGTPLKIKPHLPSNYFLSFLCVLHNICVLECVSLLPFLLKFKLNMRD